MLRNVIAIAVAACLAGLGGCMSDRMAALYAETNARAEITQVQLDRDSAAELVPIEKRLAGRIALIDGVVECICTLYPRECETEKRLHDGGVAYGRQRRTDLVLVVTVEREDQWDEAIARELVSRQIRDSGVAQFTLARPAHVHKVWVFRGYTPAKPAA